jgi:4-amino-4-deoxy-L-arabinose transferase-like glycosyltransferase
MRLRNKSQSNVPYWLVIALAFVPALVKLMCYPHNIGSDDAYIHLRIATNFLQGFDWGINPHQPVNLSTAPAFTLILIAAEKLSAHPIGLTQILSGVAVVAGLLLIFLTVLSETESIRAAFLAEIAAAFSVNLWRWNGALMEATFAFAAVAATLYLFRKDARNSLPRLLLAGVVLGVGVLLRPEMGMLVVLALFVQWMRSEASAQLKNAALVVLGIAAVVTPWYLFALQRFGTVVPTTFAAKAAVVKLINGVILREFAASIVESILFPTLLIMLLMIIVRRSTSHSERRANGLTYVIPVGWVVGLVGFYYLKTSNLASTGRYVLPLLPCQVMILALLWARMEDRLANWEMRMTAVFVGLHVIFAIALNSKVVMPVLQRFGGEYKATMQATAEKLATLTEGKSNRRVLVETDIGALSCAGNGRFEIEDGGALATPSLRGLRVTDQIRQSDPAYVVESLSVTPAGIGSKYPELLSELWERRFRQHGVSLAIPYYYTIIYQNKEAK